MNTKQRLQEQRLRRSLSRLDDGRTIPFIMIYDGKILRGVKSKHRSLYGKHLNAVWRIRRICHGE